jgi:NADPH-dependent glutamate synthase beta subunit-like oxidoreductase
MAFLPESQLAKMSMDSYQQLLKESKLSTDAKQVNYVKRVGQRLSDATMSFIRCTSVFDGQKRFQPAFDESEAMEMDFDSLIWAVGQAVEPTLAAYLEKEFGCAGLISVDEDTTQVKDRPGVFAGGDIVRGAGTVVEAVADGRRAAMAIDAWLTE